MELMDDEAVRELAAMRASTLRDLLRERGALLGEVERLKGEVKAAEARGRNWRQEKRKEDAGAVVPVGSWNWAVARMLEGLCVVTEGKAVRRIVGDCVQFWTGTEWAVDTDGSVWLCSGWVAVDAPVAE